MTVRVLILGAGTGPAENVIRSLRGGDLSVTIAGCHHDPFALKRSAADTKYLIPGVRQSKFFSALREVVTREKIDLAIPTSDAEVGRVAWLRGRLGCRTYLPQPRAIELCQDKYALNVHLRSHGVPVPRTHPVTSISKITTVFDRIARPRVWCRIRKGHGALGALVVNTPTQARAWIDYWVRVQGVRTSEFTLSEYLPGRDFSCQSLWRRGELILCKTFERVTAFSGRPGTSSVAALAKTVCEPRVADVCSAAVQCVDRRASGVYCFDVRENERGEPCVTEINAGRFGLSTTLYDLAGKYNMAVTYVRLALGEPVEIRNMYEAPEGYYLVRDSDTLASIVHVDELFDGIEDMR